MFYFRVLGLSALIFFATLNAWSAPACSEVFHPEFKSFSVQSLMGQYSRGRNNFGWALEAGLTSVFGQLGNHFPEIWGVGSFLGRENPIEFEGSHYANTFVEIARARRLLNQGDRRLRRIGLMVDGGGLCGPTCASNIFMSLLIVKGIEVNDGQFVSPRDLPKDVDVKAVKKIIDWYNDSLIDHYSQSNRKVLEVFLISQLEPKLLDPKYGVLSRFFVDSIKDLYTEMGAQLVDKIPIQAETLNGYTDRGLLIGSVEVSKAISGERPELDALHAIVVLKVDSLNKTITVSDPNAPNHIWTAPFMSQGSSIIFKSPRSYFRGEALTLFNLIDAHAVVPRDYQGEVGNNIVVDHSVGRPSGEPVVEAGNVYEPVVKGPVLKY